MEFNKTFVIFPAPQPRQEARIPSPRIDKQKISKLKQNFAYPD
jgi:hypothetical protein